MTYLRTISGTGNLASNTMCQVESHYQEGIDWSGGMQWMRLQKSNMMPLGLKKI